MGKRLSKQIVDDGQVKDESNRKESMSLNEALTTDIMADREEEVIDEKSFFRISRFQLFQDRELVRRNVGLEGVFLPASAVQIELTVLDLTDNKLTNVDCIASLLNLQNLVLRKNRITKLPLVLRMRNLERLDVSDNLLDTLPYLDENTSLSTLFTSNNRLQPELSVWIIKSRDEVVQVAATIHAHARVKSAMFTWLLLAKKINHILNKDVRIKILHLIWADRNDALWKK